MNGGEEGNIGFWWESQKEKDPQEDIDIDGWIILKWILRDIGLGGMDETDLAQDRDQWRALVDSIINFKVP
jgi:hypothetical protein